MTSPKLPSWALVAVVLAAICSCISIQRRVSVESRNKATAITLDMAVIESVAATQDASVAQTLTVLKQSGLGGVAISEDTIGEALSMGVLSLTPRTQGQRDFNRAPLILTGSPQWIARARSGLEARFPQTTFTHSSESVRTPDDRKEVVESLLLPLIPVDTLRSVSIGLSPELVQAATSAELFVIARHTNPVGASFSTVKWILNEDQRLGVNAYLPEGEQVLGQRANVREVADMLVERGILYCTPEFSKIGGDDKLASMLPEHLLQLHSIQSAEIDKMSPAEVVERFSKAARERNIRVLLIRPFSGVSDDPGQSLRESINLIRQGLAKEGVPIGAPKPFVDSQVPRTVFILIGFAVAVAGLATLQGLTTSPTLRIVGAALLFAAFAGSATEHYRWVTALSAAMIFPILAYLWLESLRQVQPIIAALALSVISLTGGLCIAGLLNGLPYFVRVEQFTAVKLAHFAPILIIGAILISRRADFKSLLARPTTWGGIAAGVFVLVALMFMLARTGNDNPAAVSGFELKIRSLLDWLLFTRPRTKEFLLGHPALILGLLVESKVRSGKWTSELAKLGAAGLLTLGAIGQTSIVNTMCHLHTPILLSLARIAIGLGMGLLAGYAVWFVTQIRRREPASI